MDLIGRHLLAVLVGLLLSLTLPAASPDAAPSGPPIRIGGTLALTGPLAAQSIPHKLVGEIYTEQLNRKNGLLGRPVEYVLLDDQSKPDLTRSLYERLITGDKVDLVIGAFGTASNLSAMAVAQRYQRLLISNTMGVPKLSTYDMHFPTQGLPPDPDRTFMNTVLDGLASTGKLPKTIAIVASKFPSTHFISVGGREVATKRGVNVVLDLEYEFGTRDFGPIAARVKEANPDFLWIGAVGLESRMLLEALKKIDYMPRGHFSIFPASGPLVAAPEAKLHLSMTTFEEHPPFTNNPAIAEFVKIYNERAAKAGLPYTKVEQQAAIGYSTWQVLEAAVTATKSLDDKVLFRWLKANRVDTIIGKQRFDAPNNFGDDFYRVRQIQGDRWLVVWPKEWAAPGAKLIYPLP
jgi:branched-chain amino acid transport system substrate-binding protein